MKGKFVGKMGNGGRGMRELENEIMGNGGRGMRELENGIMGNGGGE